MAGVEGLDAPGPMDKKSLLAYQSLSEIIHRFQIRKLLKRRF
jgi:hypothetical protein